MKKAFIICPVRNISDNYREGIEEQVRQLEKSYQVYYPARDTEQSNPEYVICYDNLSALANADVVFVVWDGKSQGCLFDLGMAFALNKEIKTITGYMPATTYHKSFQNLIFALEERSIE